jgi:hypothetical protein
VRNVHAMGKHPHSLENRSHPFFEAMRPERTCLYAVRAVILNALSKRSELEVQFYEAQSFWPNGLLGAGVTFANKIRLEIEATCRECRSSF